MARRRIEIVGIVIATVSVLTTAVGVGATIWYGQKTEPDHAAILQKVVSGAARGVTTAFLVAEERKAKPRDAEPLVSNLLADKDRCLRDLTRTVAALCDANATSEAGRRQLDAARESYITILMPHNHEEYKRWRIQSH
uniref:Uncharacterized protein n=1 Tax=Candidatus Kentrum sp. MB TaxID=2138164 RepID=A0A451B7X1_9GAMM|nr:MAG: hypothetical protein BECKMB1821I_GA0114274_100438 [Candidatus Kentron sp. MB]VFK74390.1 MAG: hypothetical protein BECKMB1821H_GA0114242_100438 [Candidatus Kentron sp. MB]